MPATTVDVRLTESGASEVREAIESVARAATEANAAIKDLASPRVQILKEPLTYEVRMARDRSAPHGLRAISTRGNYSYIKDFVLFELRTGDWRASEDRLRQHAQEMKRLAEARERIFYPDVEYEFERRAVNWANGTGGYFAPPLWLFEQFAIPPPPQRVLSGLAPQFELPASVQSVNLPRELTGPD